MNTLPINAPLYSALQKYSDKQFISFHTPGHKHGKLFNKYKNLKDEFVRNIFSMDLSVSCPEVDSLHSPSGVIKNAQDLAAKTFHSEQTYFVVGGSTLANLISIFSIFSPGDKIIVPRNIHKSVWAGIILRNLKPIFLSLDFKKGFPLNISVSNLERALRKTPDVKGIIVSSPSYDGICADLKNIVKIAHSHSIPVHVDEAWGGHFQFSNKFPEGAMDSGADSCVQSTHKILGAFSQSAMLHLNSNLINYDLFRENYNYFTTTSPFYPLLASLDLVRAILDKDGKSLIEKSFRVSKKTRSDLASLHNFSVIDKSLVGGTEFDLDINKITVLPYGRTGFDIANELKSNFGLQVEKSDERGILFLITPADSLKDAKNIFTYLSTIDRKFNQKTYVVKSTIDPVQALSSDYELVNLDNCIDKISADTIIPYPPGIPFVFPGEVLTENIIYSLKKFRDNKIEIHGAYDCSLSKIKVVKC